MTEVALANMDDAVLLRPGTGVEIVAELSRAEYALWLPPATVQLAQAIATALQR